MTSRPVESPTPNSIERVTSVIEGLEPGPVGQLLAKFPDLPDAMERAGLHLLEGSWPRAEDNELDRYEFEIDPDPDRLLAALRPVLGRRILATILRARELGLLPPGQLDVGKLGFVGEVGYAAARVLWTYLVEIEPPEDGPAHGWDRPLPVVGWLGAGEGGSWYFGVDGTGVESDDWEGARGVADAWIGRVR